MRTRRIACLILGIWMGAAAWTLYVARANVVAAEHLLLAPSDAAATYLKTFGHTSLSPLTGYLAAEQNRALFETWGVVQIVLAGAFFFFLLFGTRLGKFPLAIGLLLLLVAIGERMVVAPAMNLVSHATEFRPNLSHRAQMATQVLDYGYTMAETAKFLLGAVAAAILLFEQKRRSLGSRQQIDVIDKADYRHIDR